MSHINIRTNMSKTTSYVLLAIAITAYILIGTALRADATVSRTRAADANEKAQASQYLTSLNSTRASNGLAPLTMSGTLSAGAENHAEAMGAQNRLFHASDINARCSEVGAWSACAENVATNILGPDSVSRAASQFMGSAGHRKNILDSRFNTVGIGVEQANGSFWIVVRFMGTGSASPVVSPQQPPVKQSPAKRASSNTVVTTTTLPRVIEPVPASHVPVPAYSVMFASDPISPASIEALVFVEE